MRSHKKESTHAPISADTLFHFTKSRSNIISILQHHFNPHYCKENIRLASNANDQEFFLPMVSFCDIPLSQIHNHVAEYGPYAIGLTKEWAREKGIAPVAYIYPGSLFAGCIEKICNYSNTIDNILENDLLQLHDSENTKVALQELRTNLNYLRLNIKHYDGMQPSKNGAVCKFKYYDEREWRFIPSISLFTSREIWGYVPADDPMLAENLRIGNERLAEFCRLKFTPQDIRYIIVQNESEILEIAKDIMKIKEGYPDDERLLLLTRIISVERICNDF
jgi:hypothetical protein